MAKQEQRQLLESELTYEQIQEALLIPAETVQSASSIKLGDDKQAPKPGKEIEEIQQASMWHSEINAPFAEVSFQAAANSAPKQEAALAVAEATEKEKRETPKLQTEQVQPEPSGPLVTSQADGKDTGAGKVAELGEKQAPQQGVIDSTALSGEAPLPAARQEAVAEAIEKEKREEPKLQTEQVQPEPSRPLATSQADGKDTGAGKVAELGEKQAPQQGVIDSTALSGEAPLPAARQEAVAEAIEKEKREEPTLQTEQVQPEPSRPLAASQADGKDTGAGKVAELGEKQAPQQGVIDSTALSGEAPLPAARQEAVAEAIEKEKREEPTLQTEQVQPEPSRPLAASQADGKDTGAGKVAELGEKQAPQQGVIDSTALSGEAPLPAARQEAVAEAIEKEKREEPTLQTEQVQPEPSRPLAASQADGKDTGAGKVAELGEKQAPQQGVIDSTALSGEAPLPAARQEAVAEAIEKEKREEPTLQTEQVQPEPSRPLAASQADGKDTGAGKVAELGEKQAPQQGVIDSTALSGEAPLPAARQEAVAQAIEKEKREEPTLQTEQVQPEPSRPLAASQADGKDTGAGKVAELGEKQAPQQGVIDSTALSGEAPLQKETRKEPKLQTEQVQPEPSRPLAASQADGKDTGAGKVAELGEKQAPQQGVVDSTALSGEAPFQKDTRKEPKLQTEQVQPEPSRPLAASQADGKDTGAGKVAELGEKQAPQQGVVDSTALSGEAPLQKDTRKEPKLQTEQVQPEPSRPLAASQADGKDTGAGKVAELGEKQAPQQGVIDSTALSGEAPLPAAREDPSANLLKEEAALAVAEAIEKEKREEPKFQTEQLETEPSPLAASAAVAGPSELGSAVAATSAVQNFRQARRLRKGQNRAAGTGAPQTGAPG